FIHRLLHRHRHFAGLALAHADRTVAVTDHGQRGEAEDTTALDDLGHTIDRDHLFLQAVIALVGGLRTFGLLLGHTIPRLELETAFAGGLGQRLHAAVIQEARAVEGHLLDAGSLGAFGNQLADRFGRGLVAAVGDLGTDVRLHGGSRREHAGTATGDDLGVDV